MVLHILQAISSAPESNAVIQRELAACREVLAEWKGKQCPPPFFQPFTAKDAYSCNVNRKHNDKVDICALATEPPNEEPITNEAS